MLPLLVATCFQAKFPRTTDRCTRGAAGRFEGRPRPKKRLREVDCRFVVEMRQPEDEAGNDQ